MKQRTILIDTREQTPLEFLGRRTRRVCLPYGDYSLQGLAKSVAVERKSLADLFGSLVDGRRLEERMIKFSAELRRSAVLVEATAAQVAAGYRHSAVNGRLALAKLARLSGATGVPVFFVARAAAADFAAAWLDGAASAEGGGK